MNDALRKRLDEALNLLSNAQSIIDEVHDAEDEAYNNLPEGLQSGDKGEKMQAAIEALSEASEAISNIDLETAKE